MVTMQPKLLHRKGIWGLRILESWRLEKTSKVILPPTTNPVTLPPCTPSTRATWRALHQAELKQGFTGQERTEFLQPPFLSWLRAVIARKVQLLFSCKSINSIRVYPCLAALYCCFPPISLCSALQRYWICFWRAEKCCLPILTHVQMFSRCLLPSVKPYLDWKLGYSAL